MHKQERNQSGFGVVGVLIVFIAILLAGVAGYYSWRASRNVEENVSVTTKKYLVIEVWGVQIPYTSADTFSATTNNENQVEISSKQLGDKYGFSCAQRGAGVISRVRGADALSAQAKALYGNYESYNDLYELKMGVFASAAKVSGYIYYFLHSADYCSDPQIIGSTSNNNDATASADIDAANNFVKSILPHIEPISP